MGLAESEIDETLPAEFGAARPPAGSQPSHYWTWRLLSAGFVPEECAAIRGLGADVVLDHALRAGDCGLPIQADWFLTPSLIARLDKLIGDEPPERIRPLLARLPAGTRYEHVQLYLKCRSQSADEPDFPGPTGNWAAADARS